MQVQEGQRLGERYALESRIAVGGMGEVWRAEDELLGRAVAVKLPGPQMLADPGFAERLLREARNAAAVHHPGIAAVYDVSADESLPYLVLELVEGRPLSQVVRDEAPVDPARARHLICQVAEALDAAHAVGLVHRDVKPANLLVRADDTVKVTDFGIARAADSDSFTRTGFVTGTALYLSPEQAGGRPGSAASDMYALGVVAYELLTGRRPFEGEPLAVLHAHREDAVPPLPDTVPDDLGRLVLDLLDKDPGRRPTAAQAVGHTPFTERTSVLALPPYPPPGSAPPAPGPPTAEHLTSRPPSRRRPILLGTAAASLLVLLAVVGFSTLDGDRDGGGGGTTEAGSPAPVPVADVSLFHPGGSADDYPQEVGLAVDGDPATAWSTQRYNSPEFGNLRPGVGLLFDLGEAREVREVRLTLASPGLNLRVHAGDQPGDGLLDTPALGTATEAPQDTVVPLTEPTTARYWVVWVERLPTSGRHHAAVAETSFLG